MQAHADKANVQEKGCWAIWALAEGGSAEENRAIAKELGIGAEVEAALEAHKEAPAVQEHGARAKAALAA